MQFPVLYEASWGDIRIWLSSLEWEGGNSLVIHEQSSGSEYPVQLRGRKLATSTIEIVFDDFSGEDVVGLQALRVLEATTDERRVFTHPVLGSFYARMGKFCPMIDENSVIKASCEIVPDVVVDPISPTGAGTTILSGEMAVAQAAGNLEKKLADRGMGFSPSRLSKINFSKSLKYNMDFTLTANLNVNITGSANITAGISGSASASGTATASASASASATASASASTFADAYAEANAAAQVTAIAESTSMVSADGFAFAWAAASLTADARAITTAWASQDDVSPRQLQIESARLSQSIADLITAGELELHLELWPIFVAAIALGDALRSAAIAASADTARVFTARVQSTISLIPLAAHIYGGTDAMRRARQIAQLNDIKTPAWLTPGDYVLPEAPPGVAIGVLTGGQVR